MWLRRRQVGGPGGCWRPRRRMKLPSLATYLLLILLMMTMTEGAMAIDCFKCVSVNGDNPSCEDPFHNNFTIGMLESPCMAGRKGREGLFPATACIKLAGVYDSGQSIMIRSCALDSGTLTTDTEIIRMSHCGGFYFQKKYVKGCLQSCDDTEGCNGATTTSHFDPSTVMAGLFFLIVSHSL